MNPLLKRLATLRLKVRFLDGWLGICALVALVLGVGVSVGVLDYWIHIPSLVRAALLVGLLVTSGFIAYHYLFRPFSKPCDDLSLALRIEEAYPELNDALATTVQFLGQGDSEQARVGGSEIMRARTVQQTMEKASTCDFGRILDRRSAVLFGVGACCVLLLASTVIGMNRYYAGIAFWRFVEPFGQHTWTRITVSRQKAVEMLDQQDEDQRWKALDPQGKDRIAVGRPYFIKVNLEGKMPRRPEAKVEIVGQQIRSEKVVPLQVSSNKQSAWFTTSIDMTQQYQEFKFRILANDGSFPPRSGSWHVVKVMPPPKLIDLDDKPSPQIKIYPPAYTDLPSPKTLDPGDRHLDVLAGSNVVLRAKADRPLKEAWIEFRPENDKLIAASALSWLGQTDLWQAGALAVGGHAVWGGFPAQLEGDGSLIRVTFMPWVTGDYVLHLRDFDQLDHQMVGSLRVNVDPVPIVKLVAPRSSLTVLPNAKINFKFLVTDEHFAVRSVYVESRRKGLDEGTFEDPARTVLYDAKEYGKLLPYLMAKMTPGGLLPSIGTFGYSVRGPDLRLRRQKLEFDTVWALRNQFQEGDLVVVEVCADDFCDIYPTRDPGRSHAVELRIISRTQMNALVNRNLLDIQKEVQNVAKTQQKALDAVKETRKQEKNDQKAKDNFAENVEAAQRDVEQRVGKTSDEGLRNDLKQLRQMLKDNGLTGTQAYRDADKIQGTLESIAAQELQQIPPKLAEVRNDLTQNDKKSPKTSKKLDEAARLQGNVVKSLNELSQELDPAAKMRDIKDKVNDINQKEKNLLKELEDLNAKKQALDNNPELTPDEKDQNKKNQAAEIDKKRKEQNELANQVDKRLQEMKNAKADYEKVGDQKNAKKLEEAIKDLEEPKLEPKQKPRPEQPKEKQDPLSTQMKQVAEDLKNQNEVKNQTLEKQKNIIDKLDEVANSLEGRSEEGLKEEIKDRQDAQKKVEDLAKKLEKLRDDTKKAEKIQDKEERLKAKEKLAEQHEKLQEEIEKTRRELARLNEQRAANELKQAADNLDKAKEDIDQGNNPDEAHKKAKQELDRAKEELKQAQEELARELLVKMADQLEGLKIRQVASMERSESLHSKIMQRKTWTDPFLETMDGNIDVQKGIADETEVFAEKLKEAKVFHSILEKAKKSMDRAGEIMRERREEALDRRLEIGAKLDEMKLKDEEGWHLDTVKHQKQAVARLDRLLDAIKEELNKKPKKPAAEKPMNPDDPPPEPEKELQGGMKAQDGIPAMAQLKALRAEQLDLNERTADFAQRHPELKLNEDQLKELQGLSAEQAEIRALFEQIVAQPEPADQPEPKEKKEKKGEPK